MRRSSNEPVVPTTLKRRRSFLPRFGLRSLLILGVLFCLLFGWIGRNLYRVRQEDAAIEAILRAGGTLRLAEVADSSADLQPFCPIQDCGPGRRVWRTCSVARSS